MSGPVHLILGGARSGKSTRAETLGLAYGARRHVYVATAQALDGEMTSRIQKHQADRDPRWITVEEPLALAETVRRESDAGSVLLIDCLTLWITNVLLDAQDTGKATETLVAALSAAQGPVLCVSNEVGLGLVPDNALGQVFRDAQGILNQRVAAVASHVDFMVAGLPLTLKAPGALS